jgi:hypothetical protein
VLGSSAARISKLLLTSASAIHTFTCVSFRRRHLGCHIVAVESKVNKSLFFVATRHKDVGERFPYLLRSWRLNCRPLRWRAAKASLLGWPTRNVRMAQHRWVNSRTTGTL